MFSFKNASVLSGTLGVLSFVVLVTSTPIPGPNPDLDQFHGGYSHVTDNEFTFAAAGQNNVNRNPEQQYEQQIGYLHGQSGKTGVKLETGVYRSVGHGTTNANFITAGNNRNNHDIKFLSAGAEVGGGVMGRAALTEATVNVGHVGVSAGVGVDTGFITDGRNVEGKVLGFGGKVGADGIQVCAIICFGINW